MQIISTLIIHLIKPEICSGMLTFCQLIRSNRSLRYIIISILILITLTIIIITIVMIIMIKILIIYMILRDK